MPQPNSQRAGHIYNNILETIGNTPLVRIDRFATAHNIGAHLLAKLEYFNPMASVKDRIGVALIEALEQQNKAQPGLTTIIEPTSGNTGIALALAAAQKGYRLILVMPETMSVERQKLLTFLGAQLVLTEGAKGMKGAIAKAEELSHSIENSVIAQQFENGANPAIHYKTTGPEIWRDCAGNIDILIGGVGTGGTISGAGRFLKEKNSALKVVAVEPASSAVISGGAPGLHKIQGLGAGFIPKNLDQSVLDEVVAISNEDAVAYARQMATIEGIACGISSGAALKAAEIIGQRPENAGKNIVIIIPSFAERYLSTILFEGL